MKKKAEVTVAIPVLNREKFIEKCLRSVFSQTYKSINILIILDASTDNSLLILRKLLNDKNLNPYKFSIIEKQSSEKGIGKSRNIALDKIHSEFVFFLDADDYIESYTIEHLLCLSEKNSADIVCGSHCIHMNGITQKEILFNDCVYYNDEIRNTFFIKGNFYAPYVWNKLYRKVFIDVNKLRFPEFIPEDVVFSFRELMIASSIVFSNSITYNYVVHEDSITQSIMRNNMTFDVAESTIEYRDIVIKEAALGLAGESQIIDACVFAIIHIFRDAESSLKISKIEKKYLIKRALKMPGISFRFIVQHLRYRPRNLMTYISFNYIPVSLLSQIIRLKKLIVK